jgi:hypothetical protein
VEGSNGRKEGRMNVRVMFACRYLFWYPEVLKIQELYTVVLYGIMDLLSRHAQHLFKCCACLDNKSILFK